MLPMIQKIAFGVGSRDALNGGEALLNIFEAVGIIISVGQVMRQTFSSL